MNAEGKHLLILIEPIYATHRITDGPALSLSRNWGVVPSGGGADHCSLQSSVSPPAVWDYRHLNSRTGWGKVTQQRK